MLSVSLLPAGSHRVMILACHSCTPTQQKPPSTPHLPFPTPPPTPPLSLHPLSTPPPPPVRTLWPPYSSSRPEICSCSAMQLFRGKYVLWTRHVQRIGAVFKAAELAKNGKVFKSTSVVGKLLTVFMSSRLGAHFETIRTPASFPNCPPDKGSPLGQRMPTAMMH